MDVWEKFFRGVWYGHNFNMTFGSNSIKNSKKTTKNKKQNAFLRLIVDKIKNVIYNSNR